jgi:hypothetical protein
MTQTVNATIFHRFMTSGRTSPALCGCEDMAGRPAGDFVVKLGGGSERGVTALVCEFVASRLASHFGVPAPEAALVGIYPEFAELVAAAQPAYSQRMRRSVGLNFGSRQLNDVMTWPVDKAIPAVMWPTAVSIFAFDALIQNPDRRFSPNPNLFSRGDKIYVYDHELAFSFIEDILPAEAPWRLDRNNYLTEHVFFRRLRGKDIDLTSFTALLGALPDAPLGAILADVPAEWNNGSVSKIYNHLCAVARQSTFFADEIQRRLA